MGKIVLDIDQMKHLQKMGIDTSKASAYWHNVVKLENKKLIKECILSLSDSVPLSIKTIPSFMLQDILDLLPVCIMHENNKYELCIKRMIFEGGIKYAVFYQQQNDFEWYVMQSYEELIDASYEMLCWCAKNGFINLKK